MRDRSIAAFFALSALTAGLLAGSDDERAAAESGTTEGAAESARPSAEMILEGYRRFNGVCSHCHGPDGVGSTFAPSLIDRPISYEKFRDLALNGRARGTFVMPGYAADPNVAPYLGVIYSYLKARHEGLGRGRPSAP